MTHNQCRALKIGDAVKIIAPLHNGCVGLVRESCPATVRRYPSVRLILAGELLWYEAHEIERVTDDPEPV